MSRQYFAEVLAPIMEADQSAVTGTSEAALWPVSPWTAMVANQLQPGQAYKLTAVGVMTTAATTPGTLTLTPRWGTTTSGTSFGASAAVPNTASGSSLSALVASKTNVSWRLEAVLMCRTIGTSGSALMIGSFQCDQAGVFATTFGGVAVTIDTTTAQGIFMGVTLGSASDSITTTALLLEAKN